MTETPAKAMDELKPCPFCGRKWVHCDCGTETADEVREVREALQGVLVDLVSRFSTAAVQTANDDDWNWLLLRLDRSLQGRYWRCALEELRAALSLPPAPAEGVREALQGVVDWWDSLPPNLRQDIEHAYPVNAHKR